LNDGRVSEWFKEHAWKACVPHGTAGSNPVPSAIKKVSMNDNYEIATFGAGCFWSVEENFRKISGVVETVVGYSGGKLDNPSYEDVCRGSTGHAEVVQVKFDPKKVSYSEILEIFWNNHNPTTLNRQGLDFGDQYRSAVFFHSPEQQEIAEKLKADLGESGKWKKPIVTEITSASKFFRAEEYHQKYIKKKGGGSCGV
jgi:peptide-methionine (S)-S-oxide reductase